MRVSRVQAEGEHVVSAALAFREIPAASPVRYVHAGTSPYTDSGVTPDGAW